MSRRALPALLLALTLSSGCGDDPTGGGGPGSVVATVVSPFGGDGAVLLELTGATITDVQMPGGEAIVLHGEGAVQVAAVRAAPGEIRLVLTLEDRDATPAVRVLQAVDGENGQRSVAGYTVRLDR